MGKQKHLCKHTGMANVPNIRLPLCGWVRAGSSTCVSLLQLHSSYFTHQTTASTLHRWFSLIITTRLRSHGDLWHVLLLRKRLKYNVGHHCTLMVLIIHNTQSGAKQFLATCRLKPQYKKIERERRCEYYFLLTATCLRAFFLF